MKKQILSFALATGMFSTASAQISIPIDATQKGTPMSQMLYGIFYEDINHAADGGIYAELIRNRSFEDAPGEAQFWSPVGDKVSLEISTENLLNKAQNQCLHVRTTGDSEQGLKNEGFWGINAVKGRTYRLSFWVKTSEDLSLKASLTDQECTHNYAEQTLQAKGDGKWQKLSTVFTATESDARALFALTSRGKADFLLDVVSLFPPTYRNRENGLRPDLVEMLYELHPRFMRFPGGCFVEGQDTPDNAFRWERTVGPIEERPGHWNKNWGYRTSDGLGYHEYLQLAEDLGAKPLYVTNIGIWHGGVTPVDELEPWIEECLGAIEYANGPVSSHYGAMRAKNGHPKPFGLEYIEIGNENNQKDGQQTSDHYYERYEKFRKAILAKYPKMHIVGDVAAWGTDEPRWESELPAELVDEHYYRSPEWFARNFHKYDSYDRSWPKVYCGEYAVTDGFGNLGNQNAALGEAIFMMGMENNADMVALSSYAPIFVNENDARWRPDMIRFNSRQVMGTPSYYVQKMMSESLGTRALKIGEKSMQILPENSSIRLPEASRIGVGTWSTESSYSDVTVSYNGQEKKINCSDRQVFNNVWTGNANSIRQTGSNENHYVVFQEAIPSQKYSISLKARKDSGKEGFLILFNYENGNNYCWLNLGGWDNTGHGVETVIEGRKSTAKRVSGRIEAGKWYDVRVDVNKNRLTAYLDGQQVLETFLSNSKTLSGVFTSASMDDRNKELIVKLVNTSGAVETVELDIKGFPVRSGQLTQMKAESGTSENTLSSPTVVYPVTKKVALREEKPLVDLPPYSISIYRLKNK